jgi:hypothetical protein
MATPLITIFVRPSEDCKCKGDEFSKWRQCRKHLCWTHDGVPYRKAREHALEAMPRKLRANLRISWGEEPQDDAQAITAAVKVFLRDKAVQGVSEGTQAIYTRDLKKLVAWRQLFFSREFQLSPVSFSNCGASA